MRPLVLAVILAPLVRAAASAAGDPRRGEQRDLAHADDGTPQDGDGVDAAMPRAPEPRDRARRIRSVG